MTSRKVTLLPKQQAILEQMGEDFKLARLRRKFSAELVAERADRRLQDAKFGNKEKSAKKEIKYGNLCICRLAGIRRSTTHNVGLWEKLVNEMALKAGINMAEGIVKQYSSNHSTYLSRRFDRTSGGQRIHFASAMTLLGQSDGATGVSYLHLAEFIIQRGATATADLEQLWRRIVFYIAIKNTDDHLRNHGFLLAPQGWKLSPAYDVNPIYYGTGLSLNISETDNSLNYELANEVAKYFRVTGQQAKTIINNTKKIAKNWTRLADKYKIPSKEKDMMAAAFE